VTRLVTRLVSRIRHVDGKRHRDPLEPGFHSSNTHAPAANAANPNDAIDNAIRTARQTRLMS
jgi:hypothetical protein